MNHDNQTPPTLPDRKGMSLGGKIAIGCGAAVLLMMLAAGVGMFLTYRWVRGKINEYAAPFEARGFERVTGQQVVVRQPIEVNTLYLGQAVQLEADATAEVAIIAQLADISGTMKEKVWFRGQVLRIAPGAVLEGGLDIKAQLLENNGAIRKELTGDGLFAGIGSFPEETPEPDDDIPEELP